MAKPAPSPERLALIDAHQQRAAAQAQLAAAEDAHRLAERDFDGAQSAILEIEAEISRLKATRTHGLPHLIEEVNQRLSICFSKIDNSQRTIGPLGAAAQAAKAKLDAARYPASNSDLHIAHAARRVAAAEAEPIARAHLARLAEAFETILTYGPDLMTMRNVLPPDLVTEIETAAGGMLPRATAWREFRPAANPRHGAVQSNG